MSKLFTLAVLCCSCGSNNPFTPRNSPPNKPQTSGPFYGYVDSLVTVAAFTKDPDGDSVAYRFNWGDGDISDWTEYVKSGDPKSMSHRYNVRGLYRIRAQAKDTKEELSEWSIAREIWIQ